MTLIYEVYEGKMRTYHALAVGRYAIQQNDAPQLLQAGDVISADGALLEEGVEVRHARCGAGVVIAASVLGLCQWQPGRKRVVACVRAGRCDETRRVAHVWVREKNTLDRLTRGRPPWLTRLPNFRQLQAASPYTTITTTNESLPTAIVNDRCYESGDAPALRASDMINCA